LLLLLFDCQKVEQSVHWIKIDLLAKHLNKYDWICWLDLDTIVVDLEVRLEDFIRQAVSARPSVRPLSTLSNSDDFRSTSFWKGRGCISGWTGQHYDRPL
jgi:hypothetical protein